MGLLKSINFQIEVILYNIFFQFPWRELSFFSLLYTSQMLPQHPLPSHWWPTHTLFFFGCLSFFGALFLNKFYKIHQKEISNHMQALWYPPAAVQDRVNEHWTENSLRIRYICWNLHHHTSPHTSYSLSTFTTSFISLERASCNGVLRKNKMNEDNLENYFLFSHTSP